MYYMYKVKLSKKSTEEIRKFIGIDNAEVRLRTGVIAVSKVDDVRRLAERFEIDGVNFKDYDTFIESAEANDIDFTFRNTKKLKVGIGGDFKCGCIVRIRIDEVMHHCVIIASNDGKYNVARIILADKHEEYENCILLTKNVDVVYKNPTYKNVVTIVNEIAYDMEESDFQKGSGGEIVGRIINQEILDEIVRWNDFEKETDDN